MHQTPPLPALILCGLPFNGKPRQTVVRSKVLRAGFPNWCESPIDTQLAGEVTFMFFFYGCSTSQFGINTHSCSGILNEATELLVSVGLVAGSKHVIRDHIKV